MDIQQKALYAACKQTEMTGELTILLLFAWSLGRIL